MSIAVVTGASTGMGEEFCRALDVEGLDSIWICARRAERLEALATSLKTPCRVVAADLSTAEGVEALLSAVGAESPDIRYLVNCAGFGRFGRSWELPEGETRSMVSLNATALAEVTQGCIPFMGSGSHIVEVCSASAYLPLADLNVYSATKAFVKSYCDGLRQELEGTGISVLEVSPGWVETDFIPLARGAEDVPEKVFKHTVTRDEVVSEAMRDLQRGRPRSVCGAYNKFQVFACRHMPRVATRIWRGSLR